MYNAVRELLLLGDTAIKTIDLKKAVSQLKCNGGGRASYQQQFAVSIVIYHYEMQNLYTCNISVKIVACHIHCHGAQ